MASLMDPEDSLYFRLTGGTSVIMHTDMIM